MKDEKRMEQRIWELLVHLVAMPSDTGTHKEKEIEEVLDHILEEMAYFKQYPEQKGFYPIEGDPYERGVVWALVKGEGPRTIILMHHHDVVDVSDYGDLAPFAYDIQEIQKKLQEKTALPDVVRKDLESDEWFFGRGSADMKAGAAIQLALLEAHSHEVHRPYNLLLLSVPDEENMSVGMRTGTLLMNQLKGLYGLKYELLINSEPHERESKDCGTIYTGSVGKLMPVIYVRGKSTHIGKAFGGFNPLLIAEKLASRVELNTAFCEVANGEITPPPSVVYFKDRKKEYNVSTPPSVGFYFSLLLLKSSADDMLEKIRRLAEEAFREAIEQIEESYKQYQQLINSSLHSKDIEAKDLDPISLNKERTSLLDEEKSKALAYQVTVKSFEEIYEIAKKTHGEKFVRAYQGYVQEVKKQIETGEMTLPESTFLFIEKVLAYNPSEEPIVVLAFAPPYYPSVHQENSELIKKLSTYTQQGWQECYIEKQYFMGISDMSYVGNHLSEKAIKCLKGNMPQWKGIYEIPFEEMAALQMPMINIGPWGKDLHQYSERVYKRDVLSNTPQLISKVCQMIGPDSHESN